MTRRSFLIAGVVAAAGVARRSSPARAAETTSLPPLPYATGALEPFISSRTVEFHYGKHQRDYVDTGNRLLEGNERRRRPTGEGRRCSGERPETDAPVNAAAHAPNHDFYWKCMRPSGGGAPPGVLAERLQQSFGSTDAFRSAFLESATTLFGSGWTWLVLNGDRIEIVNTADAGTPITGKGRPLLTARRVGARVLPRLSEPSCRLRDCVAGPLGELGLCGGKPMRRAIPLAAAFVAIVAEIAIVAKLASGASLETTEEATCEMTIRLESPLDWRCWRDARECTVCGNCSDHSSDLWLHCEGDAARPERRSLPAAAQLSVCSGRGRQGA